MQRQKLTDGSGRWFDLDSCETFHESTTWDGSNHISDATGSQWDHETLYRTKGGRWILHRSSQWQGSVDRWEEINSKEAARWLSINDHEGHESCQKEYEDLTIQ